MKDQDFILDTSLSSFEYQKDEEGRPILDIQDLQERRELIENELKSVISFLENSRNIIDGFATYGDNVEFNVDDLKDFKLNNVKEAQYDIEGLMASLENLGIVSPEVIQQLDYYREAFASFWDVIPEDAEERKQFEVNMNVAGLSEADELAKMTENLVDGYDYVAKQIKELESLDPKGLLQILNKIKGGFSESLQGNIETTTGNFNNLKKSLDTARQIEGISKLIGGIGQLSSALMMLGNVKDIWNNDDLSSWEKILQLTTTLVSIFGTLTMSVKTLVTGWQEFRISMIKLFPEYVKKFTAMNLELETNEKLIDSYKRLSDAEKEELKSKMANAAGSKTQSGVSGVKVSSKNIGKIMPNPENIDGTLKPSKGFNLNKKAPAGAIVATQQTGTGFAAGLSKTLAAAKPLLLVLGKIAIVVGVIAAVTAVAVKAYNKDADAAKEATKRAEEAKNAYDSMRTAYSDLVSEISNYGDAYNALSKLKEGTLEWKQAALELNEQVLALIDKYPELAAAVEATNGVLTLNPEAVNDVLNKQFEQVQEAYRAYNLATIAKREKDIEADKTAYRRKIDYNTPSTAQLRQWERRGYTEDQILEERLKGRTTNVRDMSETELDILFKAMKKDSDLNFLASVEKIMEATGFDEVMATEIYDTKEELIKLNDSIKANTEANEALRIANAQSYLAQKSSGFRGLSENDQQRAAKLFNKQTKDAKKDIKDDKTYNSGWFSGGKSDKEVHEEYRKLMGYEKVSSWWNWGNATFEDKQGNKIKVDDKTQRAALAENAAMEQAVDDNNASIKRLKTFNKTINNSLQKSGLSDKDQTVSRELLQTGYQGKFDFSTGTDEQLQAIQKMYDSGELEKAIKKGEKGGSKVWEDAGYKSAQAYLDALKKELEEWNVPEKTAERLKNLNAAIEREYQAKMAHDAAELEISSTALDTYTKHLMETNEELKNDKLAAEAVAVASFKFAKGVKSLGEALDDNEQLLKDWKNGLTDSTEAYEAVAQVQEAVEEMFGIKVSKNFVKDHLEDLIKVANGDVKALKELEEAAAKDYVANLTITGTEEEITKVRNTLYNGLNSVKDLNLQVGAELKDENFIKSLNQMIEKGQLTSEQVQSYLNSIGYTPEFEEASAETKPQEITTISKLHYDTRFGTAELGTLRTTTTVDGVNATMFGIKNVDSDKNQKIKTIKKSSDTSARQKAVSNSGASGKKVGKGGGSEPKIEDLLKDEKDRYHDINIELAQVNNNLEKVQKETDQLVGQNKIDNLRKQYTLLNQEIEKTAEKIDIAKDEMSELQDKLNANGVQFNKDGTIANYAAAYDAQLAYVNSIINQYNGMSEAGQEAFQKTLDKAKEDFETFKENIEKYDGLLTDTIPGLEADIQDAINEQIELKIEAFHQEIEIRLEMAEAEREWNEFYKNIIKDIDKDDILGNATERLKDFMSYYKESAEGVIQVNTEHINQILSELKAMDENGVANVYGKDGTEYRKQALEDLQNYYQQLMSDLTDIHDLSDEIHESYVDMIDEAQEKFDEQIETFEKVNELLEHDKNVISMIYGEESYSALAQYYDKQEENNNKQLDFQKQQVEFWKQQMEIAEEGSDAWEAAKENWISAVDEWNSAVEAAIENLQDKYLNAINAIFQNLNNQVTNGLGLDYTESQWELINKNADQYLDSVNSIYQVQQLQNKYLDAIEKTDSPAQQKRLNDLMKQETDYLREQDKLSQYDLDRANLKYEIALKQMALEEAQQNKTMLRLRRDSQGNYTYQYTADEDQVSSIQQEIADLYNQLYNLDAEEYRGNLEEIYDVWLEFQEKMAEAAQINDPEQRAAKELLIKEQYGELINTLVEKNENAQANLYQSTMSHLFDLYNQNIVNYDEMSQEQRDILDQFMSAETDLSNAAFDNLFNLYNVNIESFKNMTDEQQEILMGSLVPQWNTAVQTMVDNIAGAGGFVPTCKEAFEEIDEATQDYMTGLEELQKNANVSFDELKDGIDETIIETEKLLEDNNELISSYEQEIEAIRGVIDELEELISKYQAASDAAKKATEDAYNYWLAEQDKNATIDATLPDPNEGIATTDNTPINNQPAAPIETPKPSLNVGSYVNVKAGSRWYRTSYGGGDGPARSGSIVLTNPGSNYPYNIDWLGWVSKSAIQGYDTGGYTGDWGSKDGRLAMLHQKELVLNASDTQNVLNAVEILRDITSNLGNTLFSRMAAISAGGASAIANGVAAEGIEQNVHIDAQFPNVTNSHEIEDALNNLMNRASQFIQQSR